MTRHFTAREFNHDIAAAKRATKDGPVIVTDRGVPAHVLLSIDEYRRLSGRPLTLAERLSNPQVAEIDFELPPRDMFPSHEIDFDFS